MFQIAQKKQMRLFLVPVVIQGSVISARTYEVEVECNCQISDITHELEKHGFGAKKIKIYKRKDDAKKNQNEMSLTKHLGDFYDRIPQKQAEDLCPDVPYPIQHGFAIVGICPDDSLYFNVI